MLPAPVVLGVLKTEAPRAQLATCSPAEVLNPSTSCKPSAPMPNGFVQSITILPARLPMLLIAASVADQGVAITTTSASLTASSAPLTRCLGNDAYFGSAGLRSPQVTSSPCLIQACPSVAPTEPRADDGDTHACLRGSPDNRSSAFSAASTTRHQEDLATRTGPTNKR